MRRTPAWAVALLVLAATVFLILRPPPVLQALQLAIFDTYQQAYPREYIESPVVIVDIDEAALNTRGQWPWPRHHMAELVQKLNEAGAAAIAFDIVFSQPDRTSPQRIAKILEENPEADGTFENVAALKDHDTIFADAVREAPIVAGVILTNTPNVSEQDIPSKAGFAFGGKDPLEYLWNYKGIIANIPEITNAAPGMGNITLVQSDRDRIVRRLPLISRHGDQIVPSLSVEALRLAQRSSTIVVRSSDASREGGGADGIAALKVGHLQIPTNGDGEIWIHYTEDVPERFVSAARVLDPSVTARDLEEEINGHIVLVGATAPALRDIIATPLKSLDYGITVHAQALEQMMLGRFLSRPQWADGAEVVAVILGTLLLTITVFWANAIWGAIIAVALVVMVNVLTIAAFTSYGWLISPLFASMGLVLSYTVMTGWRFFATAQEKARVRGAFQRYLSPDMVERVADDPASLKLGGEMRDITILFSDIRGFTSISEKMDPEALTNLLNEFLTPMTDELLAHQATIDKYIGDAIMAFWNAPIDVAGHEMKAAKATLAMLDRLHDVNQALGFHDRGSDMQPLRMGVGLNTGECCVGNMGSEQRFAYSCLGDAVNLASRLEGMSKQYAVDIIVGQQTAAPIGALALLELDLIRVVGREEPERIFALMGDETLAQSAAFGTFKSNFAAALGAYRQQDWDLARANFAAALKTVPSHISVEGLVDVYLSRIDAYLIAPPPADWDGVYDATKK